MDSHIMRRLILVIAVSGLAMALPSAGRADPPLRSGGILAVAPDTRVVFWLWPWPGCNGAPSCWAWTEGGCADEMVGHDYAVTSSIELVEDLSDGATLRTLKFHAATAGLAEGPLVVEFWNRGCRQIFTSPGEYHLFCSPGHCPGFPIPDYAHWMTITSKPGNGNIHWTLS